MFYFDQIDVIIVWLAKEKKLLKHSFIFSLCSDMHSDRILIHQRGIINDTFSFMFDIDMQDKFYSQHLEVVTFRLPWLIINNFQKEQYYDTSKTFYSQSIPNEAKTCNLVKATWSHSFSVIVFYLWGQNVCVKRSGRI